MFRLLIFLPILLLTENSFSQNVINKSGDEYILENKNIKVILNSQKPIIKEYLLKETHGILLGNIGNSLPHIFFYKGANPVYRLRTKVSYKPSYGNNRVIYHANVTYENKPAIEFNLVYILKDSALEITFKNVDEHNNFYLFNIELPNLMTVKVNNEGIAKLAIPADAGRLINVRSASFGSYEYAIDWRNPILAGFAYNSKLIGVLHTPSIENHTSVSVYERNGEKYGSFSMRLMHRLKKYDLYEFGTVITARNPKYFLEVQDSSKLTISIAGDYDRDGKVSWVDGTKIYRDTIHATPNPYYKNKTFIRAFLSRKGGTSENLTFDQVLQRIKKFAAQTDSAAYIIYLLGWQYRGHDSGYPSIDSVNEALGGYEGLVNLIQEARKYNVNVTFYDNYDDSYPTHPGWDPDVICRDPHGNLMIGGAWDGEQSYLISSYKYAVKSGLARVDHTLKKYPVEKAYFIDVLAGGYNGGRKYDFNPKSPAGAIKNFEGKKMIIDEFNKHGLDIATEDFTGYFVGYAGTFGGIIDFDKVYFKNKEQIPLIPFIYHNKTSFGMKISSRSEYVKTFLYGQRAQKFTNLRLFYTPSDYILDALPKQKLYGKAMKSYFKDGDVKKVIYEDGSTVEVNIKANTYTVMMEDGRTIARNYTSFVPVEKNVFMACSRNGGLLNYPVPEDWTDKDNIHIFKMNDDGSKDIIKFMLSNGSLSFYTKPNEPYKVIYQ